MILMDTNVTMLEKKVDKMEKLQAMTIEKEQFHVTQINILNRKIQQLQEEVEFSKLDKVIEEREEDLKAKSIKLTMKNG